MHQITANAVLWAALDEVASKHGGFTDEELIKLTDNAAQINYLDSVHNNYSMDGFDPRLQSHIWFSLYKWRRSKEVYRVDETLRKELYDGEADIVIPMDIIKCMPFESIYIQSDGWETDDGKPIDGVLVARGIPSVPEHNDILLLTWFWGVDYYYSLLLKKADDSFTVLREAGMEVHQNETLAMLQYICSVNADISPAKSQQTIYRRDSTIKDKYHEIRKWDVGIRVGRALSKSRKDVEPEGVRIVNLGNGTPKRPHIRRAHWCHYWVGPRNDPENRKQVVR